MWVPGGVLDPARTGGTDPQAPLGHRYYYNFPTISCFNNLKELRARG